MTVGERRELDVQPFRAAGDALDGQAQTKRLGPGV
jgi:hypothetical protein